MKRRNAQACEACAEVAREKGKEPKCKECEWGPPELTKENRVVKWVLEQIGAALFDGYGGVNAGNVKAVMDMLNVPKEDRPWILRRIMIFAAEQMKRGKQNNT